MPLPPFEVVRCSWPQPAVHADGVWTSPPAWHAPEMPFRPQPKWITVNGDLCWMIDWRDMFRTVATGDRSTSGEMCGFHVVFRIRVARSGTLTIWEDDGSIVRRKERPIHECRSAHSLAPHRIEVTAGEQLDVAQWQHRGDWQWGGRYEGNGIGAAAGVPDMFVTYRDLVTMRLTQPEGPALKLYASGRVPLRAVAAVYSVVLRGYVPSRILLYGEHQWTPQAREIFAQLLPWATVVPTVELLARAHELGGSRFADHARRHWFVMKSIVSLLMPPAEFCLIDDDLFVLDRVDDALEAFRRSDLVYIPDMDHSRSYIARWGWIHRQPTLRTGRFNAGLFWMRHFEDPRRLASHVLRVPPGGIAPWVWEQGLIASLYASRSTHELPSQRYFYPLFDGLPGGVLGYDYARNPCGFASIHFGGLAQKPDDDVTTLLLPDLLAGAAAV